jgi:hypothetical protein
MTARADLKEIIGRLEPLLGPSDGEPAPLDGGITNRNYRARPRRRGPRDPPARQGQGRSDNPSCTRR